MSQKTCGIGEESSNPSFRAKPRLRSDSDRVIPEYLEELKSETLWPSRVDNVSNAEFADCPLTTSTWFRQGPGKFALVRRFYQSANIQGRLRQPFLTNPIECSLDCLDFSMQPNVVSCFAVAKLPRIASSVVCSYGN